MYQHEIDALNALLKAQERTNELLERLLADKPKPVPVIRPERKQMRGKANASVNK